MCQFLCNTNAVFTYFHQNGIFNVVAAAFACKNKEMAELTCFWLQMLENFLLWWKSRTNTDQRCKSNIQTHNTGYMRHGTRSGVRFSQKLQKSFRMMVISPSVSTKIYFRDFEQVWTGTRIILLRNYVLHLKLHKRSLFHWWDSVVKETK